jgi:hypothetical protein
MAWLVRKSLAARTLEQLCLAAVLFLAVACSSSDSAQQQSGAADPKNATYTIEGREVTLTDGISEVEAAPGSAAKVTTRYFGNEASGDLNGDGTPDVAFILTQNMGGSGTFYYVAVALRNKSGYAGTNAVLLGDRISPQTTEVRSGEVIANYAERRPGEPMTAQPSIGVSKFLRVVDGKLVAR